MSTVAEIEAAIARLTPTQQREVADWMAEQLVPEETPAMLAALDAGIRALETEPTIPAEEVRRKIKAWTTG
jgi:hypothetical protein